MCFCPPFRFNHIVDEAGSAPMDQAIALRSNSGHDSIECEVTGLATGGLIARVTRRGLCWSTDDNPEASLTAKDVLIDFRRLREMAGEIRQWIELPLDEQRNKPLRNRFLLVDGGDHRLEVRFGPREDLIPAGSNPVVTAVYAFGRLRGEFSFLTDQICLRSLCEGAESVMTRQ